MSRYISKNELIEKRSWDEKLILLYLTPESSFIGEISFAYQNVIKIENYLTNVAKIDFKAKNEKTIL